MPTHHVVRPRRVDLFPFSRDHSAPRRPCWVDVAAEIGSVAVRDEVAVEGQDLVDQPALLVAVV